MGFADFGVEFAGDEAVRFVRETKVETAGHAAVGGIAED